MLTKGVAGRVVGHPVVHWQLEAKVDKCAVESTSIDSFPFVGRVPKRDGQFVAAGFSGHGRCCPRLALMPS